MYIGEHAGGLYALPSLVEEGSPLVEVRITVLCNYDSVPLVYTVFTLHLKVFISKTILEIHNAIFVIMVSINTVQVLFSLAFKWIIEVPVLLRF